MAHASAHRGKELVARYGGACANCGARIEAGQPCLYRRRRGRGTIEHFSCQTDGLTHSDRLNLSREQARGY